MLREATSYCESCSLRSGCSQVVFGEGNSQADLMFVGEGPGADEDAQGRPFVGKAGQLLDVIFTKMGIDRGNVYITNVVKCRPPKNRAPMDDEVSSCSLIVEGEIEIVKPRVLVALGSTAARYLLGHNVKITQDRGKWFEHNDIPLMLTYHPAYVLHSESHKEPEDMYRIKWDIWNDIKAAWDRSKTVEFYTGKV